MVHVGRNRARRLLQNRLKTVTLRPDLGPDRRPDNGDLEQAFSQIHQAFDPEHALEARTQRQLAEIRLDALEGEDGAVLDEVAAETGRHHQHEEGNEDRCQVAEQRAGQLLHVAAAEGELIRLLQEHPHHGGKVFCRRTPKNGDGERSARQHDEGRHFRTFDDVAVFLRFGQPFLGWFFCL
ncbi:MAG: hypothetical protein WDM89_21635 [Rhizomicrobium sp.]